MSEEATSGPLDPVALDRLRRLGGDELVREMARLFVRLGAERLAAAREGLGRDDPEVVERAAHSLKSSAGNVGAGALAEAADRAEQAAESAARGDAPANLAVLVERMEAEYALAAEELARWMERIDRAKDR
ncbi:MAG TPA: Hpt domain-containing protein [Gemmatimonadota bacterium]|nr:Hpt domain-containing protein [Gemmatimonadota bacterium]